LMSLKRQYLFAGCFCLGLALLINLATLGSWWSVADDHEIAQRLSAGRRYTISDFIFDLKTHPELFGFDVAGGRFRPVFYFLRLLEVYLWQDSPMLFHSAHTCLLGIAIFALGIMLHFFFRLLDAFLISAILTVWIQRSEAYILLGAAEGYGWVGFLVFGCGLARLLTTYGRPSSGDITTLPAGNSRSDIALWISIAVGGGLAVGSKENFLLIPGILLSCLIYLRMTTSFRFNSAAIISTAIVLLASLGVAWAVYQIMRAAGGTDYYERDASFSGRISTLSSLPTKMFSMKRMWIPSASLLIITSGYLAFRIKPSWFRFSGLSLYTYHRILLLTLLMVLTFVSQYVFYAGQIPCFCRYDLPGFLVLYLVPVCLLWLLLSIIHAAADTLRRWALCVVYVLFMTVLVAGSYARFFDGLNFARQTQEWRSRIEEISNLCATEPAKPIMIVASPREYEHTLSMVTFLTYKGVSATIHLLPIPPSGLNDKDDPTYDTRESYYRRFNLHRPNQSDTNASWLNPKLEVVLFHRLVGISTTGGWGISPLPRMESANEFHLVNLVNHY
jgi:hypothetical protein